MPIPFENFYKKNNFRPNTGTKAVKLPRYHPRSAKAALIVLNAHHTPVIGRSSRANRAPYILRGFQPVTPVLFRMP